MSFLTKRSVQIGTACLLSLASLFGFSPKDKNLSRQTSDIPAFHSGSPRNSLPPVLNSSQFPDILTQNAYRAAERLKGVLYQQPCYCYCDRAHGHESLYDCFRTVHGSKCSVCQKELFYAYEQRRSGKTAKEIRNGLIAKEWATIDLTRYESQPLK